MELLKIAETLFPIVEHAGDIELKYFYDEFEIMGKSDGSPVTAADQEAESFIKGQVRRMYPNIPFVGEESVEAGDIPDISGGTFWLVDALDGTKQFIQKTDEFSINIALMINFRPVMGVIYAPVSRDLYFGAEGKAYKRTGDETEARLIKAKHIPDDGWVIYDSRSHSNQERIKEHLDVSKIKETVKCGSSLKFCRIAEGLVDMYPRFWATSEWDTAAGHAILDAAGGAILTVDDKEFTYGKADKKFVNPYFIAYGAR